MKQDYDILIFDEMRKIGASLHVILNRRCEPYDITRVQAEVLMELQNKRQLRISELADTLSLSISNLSAIAKRMEKSGFVERVHDFRDRRIVYLQMTEKAKECLQDVCRQESLFADLNEKQFQKVMEGLQVLSAYIEERRKSNE